MFRKFRIWIARKLISCIAYDIYGDPIDDEWVKEEYGLEGDNDGRD